MIKSILNDALNTHQLLVQDHSLHQSIEQIAKGLHRCFKK